MRYLQLKKEKKNHCIICKSKSKSHLVNIIDIILTKVGFYKLSNQLYFCKKCFFVSSKSEYSQASLNKYYNFKIKYNPKKPDYNLVNQVEFIKKNFNKKLKLCEVGAETNFLKKKLNSINYKIDNYRVKKKNKTKKFDVVLLNHVLEHVSNPIIFLKKIKNKLNNGGKIVIEVPDIKKYVSKKNNTYFMTCEHLHHFSKNSLINTLALAGFKFIFEEKTLLSRKNSIRIVFQKSDHNQGIKIQKKNMRNFYRRLNIKFKNMELKKSNLILKLIEANKKYKIVFWGSNMIFYNLLFSIRNILKKKKLKIYLYDQNQKLKKVKFFKDHKIIFLSNKQLHDFQYQYQPICFVICAFTWKYDILKTLKNYFKEYKVIIPNIS